MSDSLSNHFYFYMKKRPGKVEWLVTSCWKVGTGAKISWLSLHSLLWPCICRSVLLSIPLSICLCIYLSIHPSVYAYVQKSVCPSVCLCIQQLLCPRHSANTNAEITVIRGEELVKLPWCDRCCDGDDHRVLGERGERSLPWHRSPRES